MSAQLHQPALARTGPVTVRAGQRELWYFAGCDYHGFAWDAAVIDAATQAAHQYGLGVSASRRTTGNHPLYAKLEQTLAQFFKAPASLLVSAGYLTNLCAAQALAGEIDTVYIDENAHASLADAAFHFGAQQMATFEHRSARHLAELAQAAPPGEKAVVLTDGMFSFNGSLAPLQDYRRCLPKSWWLLVDDAHGAGTLGPGGRGSLSHHRIPFSRTIQTLTLSKAFGAGGGLINGPKKLLDRIKTLSHAFIGSTPPPLPIAAAALCSARALQDDSTYIGRLTGHSNSIRQAALKAGWELAESTGPIITWHSTKPTAKAGLERIFARERIHFPWIVYPGGDKGGYLRLAISSAHPPEAIEALCRAIKTAGEDDRIG